MAIPNTVAADKKWMEIAPPRRIYLGRRRYFEKTLVPIAEERILSDGELTNGLLLSAFPAVCGFNVEYDDGIFASGESNFLKI